MPDLDNLLHRVPPAAQSVLRRLQSLILQTAAAHPEIGTLEQSIKWRQASFSSRRGSAIRLGWDVGHPTEVRLYFHCQSRLVTTFRELHGDRLQYEGNRAIVLQIKSKLATYDLAHCIYLALTYHDRKHLPLLGATKSGV